MQEIFFSTNQVAINFRERIICVDKVFGKSFTYRKEDPNLKSP